MEFLTDGKWTRREAPCPNSGRGFDSQQLDTGAHDSSSEPPRIFIDGKPGPALSASSDARQLTPQRADLTPFLSPGKHTIELRGGGSTHASV
jgi:hypothetical protein